MSTVALEAIPQEKVDEAMPSFLARADTPWNTPDEFIAIFPEVLKHDPRELLRKTAKASNHPQSRRIARMTILLDNVRWKDEYAFNIAWGVVEEFFPGDEQRQMAFYALCLARLGKKRTPDELKRLIFDWDPDFEFLLDLYPEIKKDRSALDYAISERLDYQHELSKNPAGLPRVEIEEKLATIEIELSLLEVVEDILDDKNDRALEAIADALPTYSPKDVTELFVELVSLFKLSDRLKFTEIREAASATDKEAFNVDQEEATPFDLSQLEAEPALV